jgi:hypothetical protein
MRTLESSRPALAAMGASLGRSFHAFVFVAYPVLFVVGTTAPALPVDRAAIARCLAIAVAVTAASLVALKSVIVDLSVRAACVSFASILSFGCFLMFGGGSTHVGAASLYTCGSIAIALLVVRPWQRRPRQSTALNLAACTLLVVNASRSVAAIGADEPWRPAADALIQSVVSTQAGPPAGPQPDIYYLILDGFGRPDVLQELYDLDLQPVVTAGFVNHDFLHRSLPPLRNPPSSIANALVLLSEGAFPSGFLALWPRAQPRSSCSLRCRCWTRA